MLQRVEITNGQFVRYKSGDPIPAGTYYLSHARLNVNPALKKGLAAFPVTNVATNRFAWLLPYEPWVKRVLEGWEPAEVHAYGETPSEGTAVTFGVAHVWPKLRAWQKQFLTDASRSILSYGRFCIGKNAPLGAGKTLAGLCLLNGFERPLVVAPSHLHSTWQSEAAKWGLTVPRVSTYESAHKIADADAVVFDEVLYVKNSASQRHHKAVNAARQAQAVVGFTGTPSSVNPMDLRWLRAVSPGCVPHDETSWRFLWGKDTELVEVKPEVNAYVTKTWDLDAIARFTAPWLSTVPLSEIAHELPTVTYERLYVPQPVRFKTVLRGAATENGMAKARAQARQLADGFLYDDGEQPIDMGTEKLDVLDELVRGTEEPVVIFGDFDHTVVRVAERLKDLAPAVLRGGGRDYGAEIERFTSGQTRAIVANARIATGMNLQRSRIVIFVSRSLSPIDYKQAIGRVVRPGQKASGVVIYNLLAKDTLDEPQLDLLESHGNETAAFVEKALDAELRRLAR